MVGGDDSKLYYLFPHEYLNNFTSKIISDNGLGIMGMYFPQLMIFGFALCIDVAKILFSHLNMQLFFFGCNLASSFLAFYIFLGLWIKEESRGDFLAKLAASIFYVFSNFIVYSLWQTQLFPLYLTAIFPLVLYLFIRGVREKKPEFSVWNAMLLSVFSITFLSFPWFAALLIGVIPILLQTFVIHKKSFIIHSFLLFGILTALNIYWIPHVIYSSMGSADRSGLISSVISEDFRKQNRTVIRGVSEHNSVLYPMFDLYHRRIQEDYVWHTLPVYKKFSLPVLPLNLLFIFCVLLGFLFHKKADTSTKKIFIASFIGWLVTLYFFTVQIGSWGTNLFLFMNETIPGFTMFRNMFDKFGVALGFSYAFLLAMSLKILFDYVGKTARRICFIAISALIFLNAYPFITGVFSQERPLWTTHAIFTAMTDFNPDFYELIEYLKKMKEPSRFVWIPWQNTNYIEIQDKTFENYYYIGVSPLVFLAEVSDFTGRLGLPTMIGDNIVKGLYANDYVAVAEKFRQLNAEYFIVKNEIPQEIAKSYLYGGEKGSLFDKQGPDFQKILLGEKLKDFGTRYSLYEINDRFKNEKIYLTDDIRYFPNDFLSLSYEKKKSYEYTIHIKDFDEKKHLVFLDPYYKDWDILFSDRKPLLRGEQDIVFDYANGWEVDPTFIKTRYPSGTYTINDDGSIDLDLVLYFQPQKYLNIGLVISGSAFVGCILYLISVFYRSLRRPFKK